ncbi:hypothetical protein [Cellulomonas marina]|uniref:Uncharacterized protein n=1 Tax=Cellulomonas marina TaxID=988821 RepID=A0A1I0Z4U1_9CELL|nr:hypothetical protein [Cellulomonas marina]GIG28177.1 hypothetical protein Cma02nite_07770 [Cellulomonas marina]SFB19458.1 hypothetical protein SAMN05421867_109117 [Cellulomonas marina]
MSTLDEVGARDGWRCWLCDEPVDPDASVNADLGPSVDSGGLPAAGGGKAKKGKKAAPAVERLAHRACNTRKGAVRPVVPWGADLFVVDPAPIVEIVERLGRTGGREVVARCPSRSDADEAAAWLVDRVSRLAPDLPVTAEVTPGGGQFLLALRAV